jgi:hypothetical protein
MPAPVIGSGSYVFDDGFSKLCGVCVADVVGGIRGVRLTRRYNGSLTIGIHMSGDCVDGGDTVRMALLLSRCCLPLFIGAVYRSLSSLL